MNTAAGVLIVDDREMVLGINRRGKKPGIAIPCGKSEPGEEPWETAIRETKEELGLDVNIKYGEEPFVMQEGSFKVFTYRATIIKENIPDSTREGLAVWASPADLVRGPYYQYNRYMLNHFKIPIFDSAPFFDLNDGLIKSNLPEISIISLGGFPIIHREIRGVNYPTLFGTEINKASAISFLKNALGMSAVLTYKNPKQKTLQDLGEICLQNQHGWGLHSLYVAVAFHQVPIVVRNAFSFDSRFHLSWVENETKSNLVTFSAHSSVKQWIRLLSHAEDRSFKPVQRKYFRMARDLIMPLMPEAWWQ